MTTPIDFSLPPPTCPARVWEHRRLSALTGGLRAIDWHHLYESERTGVNVGPYYLKSDAEKASDIVRLRALPSA